MQDDVTPDGCSVELYARIPALGEAEILHGRLGGSSSVLDLGCGTGRIAVPLARLGYQVVAVDESVAMLARIPTDPRIRVVCSRIQDLRLEQRFAGVLLAANLINTELDDLRGSMLTTCARHLAQGGLVLVQWRPPDWFRPGRHVEALGGIAVTRQETDLGGDLFGVSAQYRDGDRRWQHDYVARRLTTADIYRVDPLGRRTNLTYDSAGLLLTSTSAAGTPLAQTRHDRRLCLGPGEPERAISGGAARPDRPSGARRLPGSGHGFAGAGPRCETGGQLLGPVEGPISPRRRATGA